MIEEKRINWRKKAENGSILMEFTFVFLFAKVVFAMDILFMFVEEGVEVLLTNGNICRAEI